MEEIPIEPKKDNNFELPWCNQGKLDTKEVRNYYPPPESYYR